jgi:hypothetical protein
LLGTLNARLSKLEKNCPGLRPGFDRLTDEELEGLIAVIRSLEDGETIDPARLEWAEALIQREELYRLCA